MIWKSRKKIVLSDEGDTGFMVKQYYLYDIVFIVNNYYDELSEGARRVLQNAFEYKGVEHFDYIVNTQTDELIDVNLLVDNFLKAYQKVGLLIDDEEYDQIKSDLNDYAEIDEEENDRGR